MDDFAKGVAKGLVSEDFASTFCSYSIHVRVCQYDNVIEVCWWVWWFDERSCEMMWDDVGWCEIMYDDMRWWETCEFSDYTVITQAFFNDPDLVTRHPELFLVTGCHRRNSRLVESIATCPTAPGRTNLSSGPRMVKASCPNKRVSSYFTYFYFQCQITYFHIFSHIFTYFHILYTNTIIFILHV